MIIILLFSSPSIYRYLTYISHTYAPTCIQVHGGREWCDAFSVSHPEYVAISLHIILATTLGGHCGMFAVTLRDKKLIGQAREMALSGIPNIASLLYLILLWVKYPWLLQHGMLV